MHVNPTFDAALLRRYDGRRRVCTGYPVTAARLSPGFGPEALREAARLSNGDPIPRGLSLHLHLPYARYACRACGLRGIEAQEGQEWGEDLARLDREIALVAPLFDADREVVQLQFVGSLADAASVAAQVALLKSLRGRFTFAAGADVEAIIELLPGETAQARWPALVAGGFNRIRLSGADPAHCARVLAALSVPGLRGRGVDLAYGAGATGLDLAPLLAARPDRIGLFPTQQPADLDALQYLTGQLSAAGYVDLGMDQFVLPADPLLLAQERGRLHANLLGYAAHPASEVVGIGVGALSRIGDSLALNYRSGLAWRLAVDAGRLPVARGRQLTDDDELCAQVVERLACDAVVPVGQLERRYGVDFKRRFAPALAQLKPMLEEGLVALDAERLRVAGPGRLLLGHIASLFSQK
jgi:oxygen-independent coproporphyrinogen-3 oxidase